MQNACPWPILTALVEVQGHRLVGLIHVRTAVTEKWDQLLNTARFIRSFIYMIDFHFSSVEVQMFYDLANYSKCLNSKKKKIPLGTRFFARPDRPSGPPSLLYNGYRVFPGGKLRPGRAADHSLLSSAAFMEE